MGFGNPETGEEMAPLVGGAGLPVKAGALPVKDARLPFGAVKLPPGEFKEEEEAVGSFCRRPGGEKCR